MNRLGLVICVFVALAGHLRGATGITVQGWKLADSASVSAGGPALSQVSFKPKGWIKAVVPGTVLTSLVEAKRYPEPLYGLNNLSIPETLCRTSYWYRSVVPIPATFQGKHVWINFAGINYTAEIWVNGHSLGAIRGAFTRGSFEVTQYVNPGREAAVAVKINPPPHPGVPHEQSIKNGAGPNGGILGADGPTFAATLGWDWIPGIRDRSIGIWQEVTLSATGPVTVSDPYVTTRFVGPNHKQAVIRVLARLRNDSTKSQTGRLTTAILESHSESAISVVLKPGEERVVELPSITLANPRLWWPNGYGSQSLYHAQTSFQWNGAISDQQTVQFGVRTIDYFRKNSRDLTVIVNDVPILCKGGNWGMDEAMKRSPQARLDAQVRLHKEANCTMIRNWVGQATQEGFYDACDRYGILVWDDFWLANPADGPNPYDPDLFLANAKEKVLRYRNHPSIALWCGRNEGDPPKALNEGLAELVKTLDGHRFYQPHSANYNGVSGYGPYGYINPARYFQFGDAFHTEIGVPSIPTLEAIKAMMPKKDWWPINDDWAYHDLCQGAQGGDRYPRMLAQRFGPLAGLADFVRKSQLVNYESHRAIYEGRNSKLFNPASGVLIWMSNPAQPSFVWQLYSYDLEPNAALFGTKKGCEPIHIQLDPTTDEIQIINNSPKPIVDARASWTLVNLAGKTVARESVTITAETSRATRVRSGRFDAKDLGMVYFAKLVLRDRQGALLSENLYWLSNADLVGGFASDALQELNQLSVAQVSARAVSRSSRGKFSLSVVLRNEGKVVALAAHVQLRRSKSNVRVLPVWYSDNYVSLLPGETRSLTVDAGAKDLAGEDPKLVVDGFNVLVKGSGQIKIEQNQELAGPFRSSEPRIQWDGPLMPATKIDDARPGLEYRYFEGAFSSVKDLDRGEPRKIGKVGIPSLDPSANAEHFGFRYSGFFRAPKDGAYRFYLGSDDGSCLWIDGVKVIDNDGGHSLATKEGVVGLALGYHTFELRYIQMTGGAELLLELEGPALPLQAVTTKMFAVRAK